MVLSNCVQAINGIDHVMKHVYRNNRVVYMGVSFLNLDNGARVKSTPLLWVTAMNAANPTKSQMCEIKVAVDMFDQV